MTKLFVRYWRALLLLAGMGVAAAAFAQAIGASCYEQGCRAQDAATIGGGAFGHASGGGYAGNEGGDCVGDSCTAGNGITVGGICIGANCKAGDAWNTGGDCYGDGCTPGKGGAVNGKAHPAKNTACILGEMYRFPMTARPSSLYNWNTPVGTRCAWAIGFERDGKRVHAPINPVTAPSPMPAPVAVTPLPPNPYDPANLPKCPFNCQMYNPASQSCIGPQMNSCERR